MSGRMSRNKGAKYEREIVDYLVVHGYPHAERKLAGQEHDRADIAAGPIGFALELKNHARWNLAGWLDEAEEEAENSGEEFGAVIVRRSRTKHRGQDYVIVSLDTFLAITREG